MIFHLEDAIKYQVENGRFDIECVAQYHQNTRERLQKSFKIAVFGAKNRTKKMQKKYKVFFENFWELLVSFYKKK